MFDNIWLGFGVKIEGLYIFQIEGLYIRNLYIFQIEGL